MKTRIDWMNNAKEHWQDNKERLIKIMGRMTWDTDYIGKSLPMMPGEGIKAAIKEFRIPKVDAISYDCHELAPFGLCGISGHYKNADVKIYIVDEGSHLMPLCAEVTEI